MAARLRAGQLQAEGDAESTLEELLVDADSCLLARFLEGEDPRDTEILGASPKKRPKIIKNHSTFVKTIPNQ